MSARGLDAAAAAALAIGRAVFAMGQLDRRWCCYLRRSGQMHRARPTMNVCWDCQYEALVKTYKRLYARPYLR